jgi:hypothetical protein
MLRLRGAQLAYKEIRAAKHNRAFAWASALMFLGCAKRYAKRYIAGVLLKRSEWAPPPSEA